MKKLSHIMLTLIMAVLLFAPAPSSVEAANIVLFPIEDNSGYEGVEPVFYDNAIDCIKKQEVYSMIENDQVTATIDKFTVKGQVPSEEAMRSISEEHQADIVVSFKLDKLKGTDNFFSKEPEERVELFGYCTVFNAPANMYKVYKIHHDECYEKGYYTRQDLPLKVWARTVRHEMNRALNVKKLNLEKPKISKLK